MLYMLCDACQLLSNHVRSLNNELQQQLKAEPYFPYHFFLSAGGLSNLSSSLRTVPALNPLVGSRYHLMSRRIYLTHCTEGTNVPHKSAPLLFPIHICMCTALCDNVAWGNKNQICKNDKLFVTMLYVFHCINKLTYCVNMLIFGSCTVSFLPLLEIYLNRWWQDDLNHFDTWGY